MFYKSTKHVSRRNMSGALFSCTLMANNVKCLNVRHGLYLVMAYVDIPPNSCQQFNAQMGYVMINLKFRCNSFELKIYNLECVFTINWWLVNDVTKEIIGRKSVFVSENVLFKCFSHILECELLSVTKKWLGRWVKSSSFTSTWYHLFVGNS